MYLNTLFGQETIEQKSKGAHSAETDRAALPSPSSLARRRSARSGAWFARSSTASSPDMSERRCGVMVIFVIL